MTPTQADRDAFLSIHPDPESIQADVSAGAYDQAYVMKQLVLFRLAAEAAAFEKAAGVATKAATEWAQTKAYLRQHGNDGPYLSEPTGFSIATAIRNLAGEKHD